MKKSFLLHHDSLDIFNKISDEQAGILIKAICEYQITGVLPELDQITDLIITPFIKQFERDNEKWGHVAERNKINGSKGGRPKTQDNPENPVGYLETQRNPEKPRKAVSVSVSVNVSGSVNANVKEIYSYWNEKVGQNLSSDKSVVGNLTKILKDYTVDEVKKVIDYMVNNPDTYKNKGYLVISTMSRVTEFGNKLDKALNSKPQKTATNLLHRCNDSDYLGEF
jgi:uncharacterized phage protein (TIGR02220 family)